MVKKTNLVIFDTIQSLVNALFVKQLSPHMIEYTLKYKGEFPTFNFSIQPFELNKSMHGTYYGIKVARGKCLKYKVNCSLSPLS